MPHSSLHREFFCIAVISAIACTIGLFVQCAAVAQADVQSRSDVANMLRNVFERRLDWKRWHCELSANGKELSDGNWVTYRYQWELFRDVDRQKALRRNRDGSLETICRDCYAPATTMHYNTGKIREQNQVGTFVLSVYDSPDVATALLFPDVRAFGIAPQPVSFRNVNVQEFFDWEPAYVELDEEFLDGKMLLKFTCQKVENAKCVFWLSPEQANSVVRGQFYFSSPSGKEILHELTTDYKLQENEWLPVTYKFRRTVNGREEIIEEGTLSLLSLNKPIPDQVFAIAQMGIPPGTIVNWAAVNVAPPGKPGRLNWNGQQIEERLRRGQPEGVSSTATARTLLIWINIIVLAFCAFAIGRRILGTRHA